MELDTDTLASLQLEPTGLATVSAMRSNKEPLSTLVSKLLELSPKDNAIAHEFLNSFKSVLYLKLQDSQVESFLLAAHKTFFYTDSAGTVSELVMPCVLEFSPPTDKELLDCMLAKERVSASGVALDRPAPELLALVNQHYHLRQYVAQQHGVVVFDEYFSHRNRQRKGYQMAREQRRPDSAQRAERHGSKQRRSLEPDRIAATAQLRRNIRIKPKQHQLATDRGLPPWPTGPGLAAYKPKLIH